MIAQHVRFVIVGLIVYVVHNSLKSVCHEAVHQVKLEAKKKRGSFRKNNQSRYRQNPTRIYLISVSGVFLYRWLVALGRTFAFQLGQLAGHKVPFRGRCIII